MKIFKITILICIIVLPFNQVFGFTTHESVNITRTFDQTKVASNESILITVNFSHSETVDLRGFYYTDQIPEELTIETVNVVVNGAIIEDYLPEIGTVGEEYENAVPHRWVLETPTEFTESHPVSADGLVEIQYEVSSTVSGSFDLNEFNWVGYFQNADAGNQAAFGHSEPEDAVTIVFDVTPTVLNEIIIEDVNEDEAPTVIFLDNVFTDADNDDSAITKTVQSNNNSDLVTADIDGNTLTLTYLPEQSGVATIVIRGISDGLFVDESFTVTVNEVDDAPTVVQPILDITVNEDASETTIDLSDVFDDPDNENTAIIKTVESGISGIVTASIDGNILTLNYLLEQSGEETIVLRGTSNGLYVEDEFVVTVNAVDDAPTVAQVISPVEVYEDSEDTVIDLSGVFADVDNDDTAIAKSIQTNDNQGLVSASVSGDSLILDYAADQNGIANITIVGDSNGLAVSTAVVVNVIPVDDAPYVSQEIAAVTVEEDAPDTTIDLAGVFADIDNDLITKSVQGNTNPTLVATDINDNTLRLSYAPGQSGVAEITIAGESNSQTVTDTFTVTVNPGNDEPVAVDDEEITEENTSIVIRITENDYDPDGLINEDSIDIVSVPEYGTIDSQSEGQVTYTPNTDFVGEDSFTYTVLDNDGTVSNVATVTVTVNALPVKRMDLDQNVKAYKEGTLTNEEMLDFIEEYMQRQ